LDVVQMIGLGRVFFFLHWCFRCIEILFLMLVLV